MHSVRIVSAIVLVAVVILALFQFAGPPKLAPQESLRFANDSAKGVIPPMPFSKTNRYFDPDLKAAAGRVPVLVAIDATAPASDVLGLLSAPRILPAIGNTQLIRGTIDATRITELQSLPSVLAVLQDRPIGFSPADKPAVDSRLPASIGGPIRPQLSTLPRESLGGGPEVTMRDVVNFTGARRAWTQLGVTGAGVTIAVVDTGVDLGAFNLGNGSAARDANGLPTSFDPDGSTFAYTTIRLSSYTSGRFTFVTSSGTDPAIYVFDLFNVFGPYGPHILHWSNLFGAPFPRDMNVTGLPSSLSGTYHFGVLFEWNFGLDLFPAIVIDSRVAGLYDTVYLDLSFDWWLHRFQPTPDFSFSDEPMLRPAGGNLVAERDMNGDGYPDISAGSLGNFLDIWGLSPDPTTRFGVLKPVDPKGDHIAMIYDWNGHGTSVAASAAGRESNHPLAGPGIAPGARIMGVPIFAWGDVIEGWLWAAGFDLVGVAAPAYVPNYIDILRYGNWTYTGNHKADIISNSWGVSDWILTPFFAQWAWYDVLTVFEDALMTPGYATPAYPGTVMVHAGGNGASGYGTVTEPGFSDLAITVGASTSMNWTRLLWGTAGGFHNDVISWSARGPNALGAPKPDLVQVGAFAWAAGPVKLGRGNGANAYILFGGTSQATPVTSGSAAVMIEAFRKAHGTSPSPFQVKSILKSTAIDLGYDAFVQGAGQVNVYNAAAYALGNAGLRVASSATWDNVRPRLTFPWAQASAFYGQQLGVASPAGPIGDTSWFAGSLHPGESTNASFEVDAAKGTVSGTISAVWHSRIGAGLTILTTTSTLAGGWLEGFGALNSLPPTAIPASADLMVVRAIMPFSYFDSNGDYIWDNRSRIIVGDWVDANGDGIPQIGEVRIFNYGYNTGTTVEARVGFPTTRFAGRPFLWFSQVPAPGHTFVPMPITIRVEFYQRVAWPWITLPGTFSASPTSPAVWSATLAVPAGTNPGVYEGQILLTPAAGNVTAVPVSVVVPRVIDASTLKASLTTTGSTQIYDPSSVDGYFDWRWRYEAGDWKLWTVDVTDPSVVALRVDVAWSGRNTDVDIWSITPSGVPGDSSFSTYLGSGVFRWGTRTGTTADYVIVSTSSSFVQPGPGLYTFALHNVLFGGGPTREALTGTASVVKLNPRGPVTVVTQPGKTVSVPFTLSTGYNLDGLFFGMASAPQFSAFPASTEPGFVPRVSTGSSLATWANITVPAGTPDGTYAEYLVFAANQLPGVIARVDVIVDSTAPVVSLLAPTANAQLRGAVTITAATSDANAIASVSFAAGSASGAMVRDATTGTWTGTWDTTGSADGATSIVVTATDVAGNRGTTSRSVVVDNTPPQVAISAPAANANLRGTSVITWSASDANLLQVWLVIDGQARDVTGTTSYSWNTNAVGDGSHTIVVRAVDKAGNQREARVTVTTDNVSVATGNALTTGLTQGLIIGLVVAAAAGFVFGFLLGRRRKPGEPKPGEPKAEEPKPETVQPPPPPKWEDQL